jgi:hypothetical protein
MNGLICKTNPYLHSRAIRWDISPALPKAIRLGEVEAADEREAIEKAAKKFEQDPAKLTFRMSKGQFLSNFGGALVGVRDRGAPRSRQAVRSRAPKPS